jgi:Family of unknown function (DUF6058)
MAMPYPTTFPPDAVDQTVVDVAGDSRPRLTTSTELARRLAELDDHYIRANFVRLDQLAAPRPGGTPAVVRQIAARRLPQPAYRLDDGTDMVPDDYFTLLDVAGSVDALRASFHARYVAAAGSMGLPINDAAVEAQWQSYLGGGYFVCLRQATPENIARKEDFITTIDDLLAQPLPRDPAWCRRLRAAVDGLADIERPGAILDPPRWGGPMSPQWYGSYLRATYPAAFGPETADVAS